MAKNMLRKPEHVLKSYLVSAKARALQGKGTLSGTSKSEFEQ